MGLFGRRKQEPTPVLEASSAVQDKASALVGRVLAIGVDGKAGFKSARTIAERARGEDDAIAHVITRHSRLAGGAGFLTGLGGFITLPIALPANVVGFHVLATRMVAAIAELRGYDTKEPRIRTAVLLTLAGSEADKVLNKVGVSTSPGIGLGVLASRLPKSVLMVVNKAIGFRMLTGLSTKLLGRLGRAVPVLGGLVGGAVDMTMAKRIGEAAQREFPARGGRRSHRR